MKTFIATLVAATSLVATPILAADLAVKAPPPPAPPPPTWTGCYLGVEGGYGWFTKMQDSVGYPATFASKSFSQTGDAQGGMGGVQVGCDYQWGNQWVVGVIATYDFSSIAGSSTTFPPTTGGNFQHTFSEDLNGFGTVRGRVGWLFAPSWLVYGSGGLAYGRVITSATQQFTVGTTIMSDQGQATWVTGWTAGGGVEWKFNPHISVFAEYLYADLGSVTGRGETNPTVTPFVVTDDYGRTKVNVLKGGVNWRF